MVNAEINSRRGPLLRITPPAMYSGRAWAVVERSVLTYSRSWFVLASGIFEPLLYLLAFQVGFGKLVGEVSGPDGQPMSYVAFVAPGLLVASAMNGAVFDSTFGVFFKFRHAKTYDAMLATPVGPLDIVLGEISWAVIRGGLYSLAFFTVMTVMGLVTSLWALLLVPTAMLVSFAFAAMGMAAATLLRSTSQFDYIQLAVVPMFLFSTTLFPLSAYPEALGYLVRCFPLYHGVELARGFSTGVLDIGMIGHVAYLVLLVAIGLYAASRRLAVLLLR